MIVGCVYMIPNWASFRDETLSILRLHEKKFQKRKLEWNVDVWIAHSIRSNLSHLQLCRQICAGINSYVVYIKLEQPCDQILFWIKTGTRT